MNSYDEFIDLCRLREFPDGVSETHHIVPRCMGGGDDADNLIKLTPIEHYTAHKLLALENPEHLGLQQAWWCMSNKGKYDVDGEDYERARINRSIANSKQQSAIAANGDHVFQLRSSEFEHKKVVDGTHNTAGVLPWDHPVAKNNPIAQKLWRKLPELYKLWLDTGKLKYYRFATIAMKNGFAGDRHSAYESMYSWMSGNPQKHHPERGIEWLIDQHNKYDWR